jgi:hypothetical protein
MEVLPWTASGEGWKKNSMRFCEGWPPWANGFSGNSGRAAGCLTIQKSNSRRTTWDGG